jgi:hypothetical protein
MVLALGVRKGVADLHAAGVFPDRQAPGFNRRVRGRLYEILLANRIAGMSPDHPLRVYVRNLTDGYRGRYSVGPFKGAVARAVSEFAAEVGLSPANAVALRDAALEGLVAVHASANRLSRATERPDDLERISDCIRSIPPCWEPPEVSDEFAALVAQYPAR